MPAAPTTGTFAGMTVAQLQTLRVTAQTALTDLLTGGKPVMVSYGNGEGQRQVTYTRANEIGLRNLIAELNQALGAGGRHALSVSFR